MAYIEKNDYFDYVIVGAGIGGLMFAYQMGENNRDAKILVVEKGDVLFNRKCPINEGKVSKCINCKNCAIMSGVAGAGAFSDAKFNITTEYGGWIDDYISINDALDYMERLDNILMELRDKTKTPRIYYPNNELQKKALEYDLHLLQGKVRHFGTDGIYTVMQNLEDKLFNEKYGNNIQLLTNTYVSSEDIDVENKKLYLNIPNNMGTKGYVTYGKLILSVGRFGADMFHEFCIDNNIPVANNQIDIGVRVECPRIICEDISEKIYEPKIKYLTKKHRDIVRTFCFNSGGEVVTENTNGILTVNGHANSDPQKKTKNSNFAILSTHNFTEPFNEPIEYLQHVARLANMLGGGKIIAQLFGDLLDGRRSTDKRINCGTVKPTLKSYTAGDISLAMPSAAMDNIIEMLFQLNKFMPGVANHDTILYGIEAKYYSCKPNFIDNKTFKIYDDVYAIGDGAGVTRSLSQAGAMGLYLADNI